MGEKPNSREAESGEPGENKKRDIEVPSRVAGKDIVSAVANRKHLNIEEWDVRHREIREALSVRIQNEQEISNVKFYWILQGFR